MEENKQAVRKIGISVPEWRELVKSGCEIPVETTLDGTSMQPFIRRGLDTVTVCPLRRKPKRGDIVLFVDHRGKHVVHRVYKTEQNTVWTLGDGCNAPDPPVSYEDIGGIVTQVRRGNRTVNTDTAFSRLLGKIWMSSLFLRPAMHRVYKLFK